MVNLSTNRKEKSFSIGSSGVYLLERQRNLFSGNPIGFTIQKQKITKMKETEKSAERTIYPGQIENDGFLPLSFRIFQCPALNSPPSPTILKLSLRFLFLFLLCSNPPNIFLPSAASLPAFQLFHALRGMVGLLSPACLQEALRIRSLFL